MSDSSLAHDQGRSAIAATLRAAGCVWAEDEARLLILEARSPDELAAMVRRRAAGTPLEHVLGWASFCGVRIGVDPGVFVPRRRTELLVHEAKALARASGRGARPGAGTPPVIVDLCCGTGAVGVALARALEKVELYSVDLDPVAVRCARRNLEATGAEVLRGDLYQPLPSLLLGRVDVIVANAPYVPTDAIGTLPREAREYERRMALDGGADGLAVQRRVVAGAREWLGSVGHLLIETSVRQASATAEVMRHAGLAAKIVRSDELDAAVVIGANRAEQRRA